MKKKIAIRDILEVIEAAKLIGKPSAKIDNIKAINSDNIDDSTLTWVSEKNIMELKKIKKGTIICPNNNVAIPKNSKCNYIFVKNPRHAFGKIIKAFFVPKLEYKISETSTIHNTVLIKKNVLIGNNVVIEKNCIINDKVIIGHNTIIKEGTVIGNQVKIGCNCTIGGDGFGYEKNEKGVYEFIPHLGNVVIEDNVEIGNNTCIDRAVLGSTLIQKNTKIDNLVHIAHGVKINSNSLVIANSTICGSVSIGKDVWIAPSATIINKIQIEDNSVIGMGAIVLKNVDKSTTVVGNPAKAINKK